MGPTAIKDIMKPLSYTHRLLMVVALLFFYSIRLNAYISLHAQVTSFAIYCDSFSEVLFLNTNEVPQPLNGGLIVLAEYTRAGMRYNPTNNEKKGGCMLKISRIANDDGTQEHYAITGYAVDNVEGQWIWHNCLSNSVKYNSVKGVYTAFVNGLGNVYFSI